mmetsp:Transcript_7647/g.18715  ORF Transcript_7647/g.18715 Transcript_7647/m.18715 type:complete len:273 (-) Transcript_7647:409-1227(-)
MRANLSRSLSPYFLRSYSAIMSNGSTTDRLWPTFLLKRGMLTVDLNLPPALDEAKESDRSSLSLSSLDVPGRGRERTAGDTPGASTGLWLSAAAAGGLSVPPCLPSLSALPTFLRCLSFMCTAFCIPFSISLSTKALSFSSPSPPTSSSLSASGRTTSRTSSSVAPNLVLSLVTRLSTAFCLRRDERALSVLPQLTLQLPGKGEGDEAESAIVNAWGETKEEQRQLQSHHDVWMGLVLSCLPACLSQKGAVRSASVRTSIAVCVAVFEATYW